MHLLVVCVDRDDDLGRKAKVVGPILGRKENIKAATKLALKDPLDSDVNCIFAAVRKFDELKEKHTVEIVTLTGKAKFGFESDRKINEQLDAVLEKFPAEGFVLVTDGAEDDQIMPILQSRAKIISKENVIVKQAKEVESTFYTIKEALKDPFLARLVFGIPGLILLLLFAVPSIGLQLIMLIAGVYLLSKGFGLEEMALNTLNEIISSISLQKTSFPFYLATLFILGFGLLSGYNAYLQSITEPLVQQLIDIINPMLFFLIIAILIFYLGRSIDAIHLKKAFYLKRYFRSAVSAILIWFILDSGRLVFIGKTDLNLCLLTIVSAVVIFYIAFRISNVFDVRNKITGLLIGLPVYSARGMMLGKVETVDKRRQAIEFKD
jgi:putative membrane protein